MNFSRSKLLLAAVACLSPLASAEAPFPSTYEVPPHNPTLITNATVLTGDGQRLDGASVYFANGKIVEVSNSTPVVGADTR
ncbi:MAG: amidohydrolase, partial [Proteobacteria bacterium]